MGADFRGLEAFLSFYFSQVGALTVILLITLTGLGLGITERISATTRLQSNAANYGPDLDVKLANPGMPVFLPGMPEAEPTVTVPVPVYAKVPTGEPIVFLGIDDGLLKNPEALKWLKQHRLPFTLFLDDDAIKDDYAFFNSLQSSGMTIQNHTLHHPDLTTLNYDQQKAEICGASSRFETVFGQRPTLFRPPYGSYNDITRQVVAECGMKAIILWHAKANGGIMEFQDVNHLEPGDIVLMHFRPKFIEDANAFMAEVNNQHLNVGRLEDWIN